MSPQKDFVAATPDKEMATASSEILLVTSAYGDITAYDASTGAIVAHFTGSLPPRKGLTSAGDSMIVTSHISSDSTAGYIHLYNWWSSIASQQIRLPEPVAPLASSPDGLYLFGGGLSGNIHALKLPSGDLLGSFPAHCKPVSCMTINDDSSLLISGGDDGSMCVSPILSVLDSSPNDDCNQLAFNRFTGHDSTVTSITIGKGGSSSIIISCSLDCTCKFWSLTDASHIRTVHFPCMIWSLTMDPSEPEFYAGGSDGRVYVGVMKVTGPQSVAGDAELVVWTPEHDGALTAMVMVNEGLNVVSASEDGNIRIWEAGSGAVVKVIANEGGSIRNLVVMKGNRDCSHSGIRLRTSGIECDRQSLGCDREITRQVRELNERNEALNVAVKDRRRAIDTLDASIRTYQRLLELILSEFKANK